MIISCDSVKNSSTITLRILIKLVIYASKIYHIYWTYTNDSMCDSMAHWHMHTIIYKWMQTSANGTHQIYAYLLQLFMLMANEKRLHKNHKNYNIMLASEHKYAINANANFSVSPHAKAKHSVYKNKKIPPPTLLELFISGILKSNIGENTTHTESLSSTWKSVIYIWLWTLK